MSGKKIEMKELYIDLQTLDGILKERLVRHLRMNIRGEVKAKVKDIIRYEINNSIEKHLNRISQELESKLVDYFQIKFKAISDNLAFSADQVPALAEDFQEQLTDLAKEIDEIKKNGFTC